jgi:hypothetical protein
LLLLLLLCRCSCQATAADLVGIERGARQLQELGVEAAVLAVLSQQTAARRTPLQLPPASQVNDGCSNVLCRAPGVGPACCKQRKLLGFVMYC